jgi:multiple sugar transport system permease protein
MLIFLGAFNTIPEELYEAAKIDGAGYFRRLRYITLPLISPFVFFLITVSMIYAVQVFIQPFLLNPYRAPAGGQVIAGFTPKETMFVMAKAYIDIVGYGRWGYGHALLWLLFLLILLLTLVFYRFRRLWVYSETDDTKG